MRKLIWIILFFALVFRIGVFYQTRPFYPNGTKIRLTDRVSSEPIRYTDSQYLRFAGFKIYLPLYPEISYGDKIVIEGKVSDGKLKDTKLLEVIEAKGVLYTLRKRLITFYQSSLPEPHSSLIAGVTIGSKASIPQDFWDNLKTTGTAHVVVASGMNVTLVAQFLISFLALVLPRRKAIPLALLGIWSYAVISGFDAPIIRASIMGSLVFVAQEIGRLSLSIRALFLTAFVMLFTKPEWIYDIGFWLSFTATLSLILFEPRVDRVLRKIPGIIRKDLSTSLAAQVGVAPILYFGFGQFNPLSPLINALILWSVVPMTMLGMIGGAVSLFYEPFAKALLWLTYPLTSWFIGIVRIFG